jgi:hypothetical protein
MSCLALACTPVAPRVFLFVAALLSLAYFPQLFGEITCSGHSTILIPSILFLLSCAPSLDHQVRSDSEWPLVLIRIYIASGYFSSGMCKLLCGARFKRFWGKGPTLQLYIFDGMWSRPAGPTLRAVQRALLTSPWLATVFATGAVLFEVGFILAPTSDALCLLFGLNGLAFHLGIFLLQGLDFVSWWMPALFAFLVGLPSREPWMASIRGVHQETGFFVPAAIYVALQVLTSLTLHDFWLDDILPFSCCPMFMLPRNPFDEWPKWWTMTDALPMSGSRLTDGVLEPLYWSPVSPIFSMPLSEAAKLPYRALWFGSTRQLPSEMRRFVHQEHANQPFVFFANFDVSDELRARLRQVTLETTSGAPAGEPHRAWDGHSMAKLLAMQEECLRLFARDAEAARLAQHAAARIKAS